MNIWKIPVFVRLYTVILTILDIFVTIYYHSARNYFITIVMKFDN